MTFRFYDHILSHCQTNVSQKTKQIFKFKNIYRLNLFKNESMKQKMLEKVGLADDLTEENPVAKLTFKHSVVSQKEKDMINHHNSIHARALQRSNYLVIDDDINNIQETFGI